MKEYSIHIDPEKDGGRLENILGMCNSPIITSRDGRERQEKWFRELGPSYVRHHDAALENPGQDIVDVSRIFPIFSADENDPKNYRFAETDYYFGTFVNTGVKLELRLGESIDHSGLSCRVNMPEDPEKWARICLNILRHYRDGWADGMFIPIDRVSVWEEPGTVPALFTGSYDDYIRLFLAAYPVLHEAYPDLCIGAHNDNWGYGKDHVKELLTACRDAGIVPGFIGVTSYSRRVEDFTDCAKELREILDSFGFFETQIQFSEWHYGPLCWSGDVPSRWRENGFDTAENAAFTAATLIALLDTPTDIAYYYAWGCGSWSVLPPRVSPQRLWPVYYGLKFFADTARFGERAAVSGDLPENTYVLAAKNGKKLRILLSCLNCEDQVLHITVPDCHTGVRYVIEDDGIFHPAEGTAFTISAPGDFSVRGNCTFSLPVLRGSRVYALEVE